jgi:hypothetical protein
MLRHDLSRPGRTAVTNVEEMTEETTGEERPSRPENCDTPDVRPLQEFIDNLPYGAVVLVGAAILWIGVGAGVWRWLAPALFIAYGVAGTVWIMAFICPYCHFYDTRLCPCGYGRIAPLLRARKGPDGFSRQFRRHIPVIVPLWFIPLVAGFVFLVNAFSWLLLALVVLFAVNSFVVLPLVSREYGCARCPQKDACPWMAKCRS